MSQFTPPFYLGRLTAKIDSNLSITETKSHHASLHPINWTKHKEKNKQERHKPASHWNHADKKTEYKNSTLDSEKTYMLATLQEAAKKEHNFSDSSIMKIISSVIYL